MSTGGRQHLQPNESSQEQHKTITHESQEPAPSERVSFANGGENSRSSGITSKNHMREVAQLGPGKSFGEFALIR